MFKDEKLELKVGLFIGIAIFLMFLIVFSIKDVSLMGKGYEINVIFDYVNGVTDDSPVRLAGVNVGEVKSIELFYDGEKERTRVRLNVSPISSRDLPCTRRVMIVLSRADSVFTLVCPPVAFPRSCCTYAHTLDQTGRLVLTSPSRDRQPSWSIGP